MSLSAEKLNAILAQPRWKLARATELSNDLKGRIQRFSVAVDCKVTLRPTDGGMVWQVACKPISPPPELSYVFGDIVHNLRTALDWLAIVVVEANEGNPKGVYFPFSKDENGFDEALHKSNLRRAAAAVVDEVRNLKPYYGGHDLLRMLHELDIIDKHRKIVSTVLGSIPTSVKIKTLSTPPSMYEGRVGNSVEAAFIQTPFPIVNGYRSALIPSSESELIGHELPVEPVLLLMEAPWLFSDAAGLTDDFLGICKDIIDRIEKAAKAA